MIVRNDHLMRALQQMDAAYLQAVGQTRDQIDDDAALATVDNALANTFGTRAELIGILGTDLIDSLDPTLSAHAARLLGLRGRLLAELNQPDLAIHAMRLAHRAMMKLLDHVFEDEKREAAYHVEVLVKHPLAVYGFTTEELEVTYTELFSYHAGQSHFDRAEDCLFHALELTSEPDELRRRGLKFYDHLLTLPNDALDRGGLPRREVEDARRELLELD
ncbi:MAG: DUF6483 family protein [Bradymonadaceae bacterium]